MKPSSIYDCSILELNRHCHPSGSITAVENSRTIPFNIKRAYYLYDIPGGESRGGHAHRELYQFIVAASGSFEVAIDDGSIKRFFTLNRPNYGLIIVPGIWRELTNFSSGSVCLVLASLPFDESDYIRDYQEYLKYVLK